MEELRGTRVIFVTAVTDEGILEQARQAGPFALLTKPVDREEILGTLRRAAEG